MGAEALVRWDHPERGMLYPQAFLPLAEETGLIGELDRWVVETALQQARRWTRPGAEVLLDWISVNVSPQFVESGLLPLAA
jgi:EAL domain-containing protein (putative c-di-GMP-specific phosphodiesterase class I)